MTIQLRYVSLGSPEWRHARELRYSIFFAVHGLSAEVMDDEHEAEAAHLVAHEQDLVVGYGRLTCLGGSRFQISQMVVRPSNQHRRIGKALLSALLVRARASGGVEVVLNARVGAVGFYEGAGFVTCGEPFPSKATGVLHVQMKKILGAKEAAKTSERQA